MRSGALRPAERLVNSLLISFFTLTSADPKNLLHARWAATTLPKSSRPPFDRDTRCSLVADDDRSSPQMGVANYGI